MVLADKNSAIYIIGFIEPFATFFKMYGALIVWIWVITILVISAGISRAYCRYVCPLGAFFALLSRLSGRLGLRKLNIILAEGNCTGCMKAKNSCQMNAINYNKIENKPEIDSEECFMCNTCTEICPVLEKNGKK